MHSFSRGPGAACALLISFLAVGCSGEDLTRPIGAEHDAPVAPGVATAPEIEDLRFTFSDAEDCGAFQNLTEGAAKIRFITFFDRGGTPIRLDILVNFDVTHTNSVTGTTLPDDGAGLNRFDLVTGQFTFTGKRFVVTEQGRGLLFAGTGRIVIDENGELVFSAGHDDDLVQGDPDWCALLA